MNVLLNGISKMSFQIGIMIISIMILVKKGTHLTKFILKVNNITEKLNNFNKILTISKLYNTLNFYKL